MSLIAATGAAPTDDLILNANVTASGGNGDIALNAADDNLGTPLTFEVDLVAGQAYRVCILTGDTLWNHDREQFQVYDPNGVVPPLNPDPFDPKYTQRVDTWGAGAPDTRTFTVTVSGGALELRLQDLGGQDGNFVIAGLDISAGTTLPGVGPLLAAGDPLDSGAAAINSDVLQPVVAEATARWSAAGLTPAQAATLANVQFAVADLGGAYLGLANPATNTVRIDDAAMLGLGGISDRSSVISDRSSVISGR